MRNKNPFLHSIAGVGLLTLSSMFAGCGLQNPVPAPGTGGMEVRTYEVPEEYQDDLRGMLQSALQPVGDNPNPRGRVINGPGGTLLVTASARIQAGIEQVLTQDLDARPVSRPVSLTYWILVGRPRESSQPQPFSVVGGSIPQLEPVLGQIASADGSTEFSLLEQVQLTSMNQEAARVSGQFFSVGQTTVRSGEKVVVDVEIGGWGNAFGEPVGPAPGLRSRVVLEVGQFLVLGRTGFGGTLPDAFPDSRGENDLALYYVIAAAS